jgi:hypothetical protein
MDKKMNFSYFETMFLERLKIATYKDIENSYFSRKEIQEMFDPTDKFKVNRTMSEFQDMGLLLLFHKGKRAEYCLNLLWRKPVA